MLHEAEWGVSGPVFSGLFSFVLFENKLANRKREDRKINFICISFPFSFFFLLSLFSLFLFLSFFFFFSPFFSFGPDVS